MHRYRLVPIGLLALAILALAVLSCSKVTNPGGGSPGGGVVHRLAVMDSLGARLSAYAVRDSVHALDSLLAYARRSGEFASVEKGPEHRWGHGEPTGTS